MIIWNLEFPAFLMWRIGHVTQSTETGGKNVLESSFPEIKPFLPLCDFFLNKLAEIRLKVAVPLCSLKMIINMNPYTKSSRTERSRLRNVAILAPSKAQP